MPNPPPSEMLVTSREKRRNAGAKMMKLLESEDCDDFYKSTYGGFFEEEDDAVFSSPAESSSDESFDSDDDREQEVESDQADEDDEKPKRKRGRVVTKAYKEPIAGKPHGKHFFRARPVRERRIHKGLKHYKIYSQEERLQIAKKTEIENLSSLENYRKFELEKKAKARTSKRRDLSAVPHIRYHSTVMPSSTSADDVTDASRDLDASAVSCVQSDGSKVTRTFISFTDELTYTRECPFAVDKKPKRREPRVKYCAVTGVPAKYICPLTGLPYANADAFRVLRTALAKHVAEKVGDECIMKNEPLSEWLESWGVVKQESA